MTQQQIQMLPIDKVIPTPENMRVFPKKPDKDLQALATSIEQHGVLEPVLARPHPKQKGHFDMRAGERRWRAARIAGLKEIPCIVRAMDDKTAAEITVTENFHREDLHPLEEAKAVDVLLKYESLEDAAAVLDKTVHWVKRRSKLTALEPCWRKSATDDSEDNIFADWSARHFEQIARLPKKTQLVAHEQMKNDWEAPRTYSELKQYLGRLIFLLAGAPWSLDDADLVKKAGACAKCRKRSACEPELFDDLDPIAKKKQSDDRCLDGECWAGKAMAQAKRAFAESQEQHGADLPLLVTYSNKDKMTEALKPSLTIGDREVGKAKKGDKGARQAFDANKCQVVWIKSYSSESPGKRAKGTPSTLKERRAKLQKRRDVAVVAKLIEMIEDPHKNGLKLEQADLLRALAIFGTHTNRGKRREFYGKALETDWDLLADVPVVEIAEDRLFRSLLGTFLQRLNPSGFDAPYIAEARKIAHFLDIDLAAIEQTVKAEIPEPKSWAKLNADGTPKTAEYKPVKEKPATKAAKKTAAKKSGKGKKAT